MASCVLTEFMNPISLSKHALHSFKVAVAVEIVRLEIARLGPLVPAVDRHELMLIRVPLEVFLCHAQTELEVFGRVVPRNRAAEALEARIVVPAYRDVREVDILRVVLVDSVVLLLHVLQNIEVIAVHVAEVRELIVRHAVEAERLKLRL